MTNRRLNLIYALKNGVAISIENVESGLKCNCTCPACGAALIARKGSKRTNHFAHQSTDNCEYGYETSLYFAAKDIISEAQKVTLPPVYVTFPHSYKPKELYYESREINVEKVELEKLFNNVVPTIVIYACGKKFYLEIVATHKMDEVKLNKIKQSHISTLVVDLSFMNSTILYEDLKDILLSNRQEKTWKYNYIAEKKLKQFYDNADKRPLISRGMAQHVDNCPIQMRIRKGKPYANFWDDCLCCRYCISTMADDGILCSGRTRIATIEDFDIPENDRIKNSNEVTNKCKPYYHKPYHGNYDYESLATGQCPVCKGKLETMERGNWGSFLRCSNYPNCNFSTEKAFTSFL